ncbi:MAG: aspartate kinase [Pseudomonadota bacterium]|nr:aspartate kinase [Pseudomonadota bacterium]
MLLVQKYGGSSVSDVERLRKVAARVARARGRGDSVVVVVSAMGNTTNELLALARTVTQSPGRRELDMLISVGERVSMALLAMALQELGVPARSFTGSQSGIITDTSHASARVVEVRPDRVREAIARGEVAIVAGFQGVSREREVTTLGRGGSDTTAVVLAAALQADECEICSDVDGVYSADPRAVPAAVRLDTMTLDEALALAQNGAKVLYDEAVAWARREGITLRASATFSDTGGTRIHPGAAPPRIVAIAADTQLARGPLALLDKLPAPCVRAAGPDGVLLDRRNLHAELPGLIPAATVAVVGARAGSDPTVLLRILNAAGPDATRWRAAADAVVFEVDPARAARLERALHAGLLECPSA